MQVLWRRGGLEADPNPSSSAYRTPLLDIGLSKCTPLISIFGFSHPAPASRLAQVITPPQADPNIVRKKARRMRMMRETRKVNSSVLTCLLCNPMIVFKIKSPINQNQSLTDWF
ncbi:hypothetical protein B5X24_HaOG208013 [Helicoverpa armigera]|nr:hypothetical protein B5X24_HaOG208013 [Helicoverpa armigera]